MSHLSTALMVLFTYSRTPPAPRPTALWLARSNLNRLYPSKAISPSLCSGFVHDSAIPIMSGASLSTYNSNSALFVIVTIPLTFANMHFKKDLQIVSLTLLPSHLLPLLIVSSSLGFPVLLVQHLASLFTVLAALPSPIFSSIFSISL